MFLQVVSNAERPFISDSQERRKHPPSSKSATEFLVPPPAILVPPPAIARDPGSAGACTMTWTNLLSRTGWNCSDNNIIFSISSSFGHSMETRSSTGTSTRQTLRSLCALISPKALFFLRISSLRRKTLLPAIGSLTVNVERCLRI